MTASSDMGWLEAEGFELIEHVGDARPDDVALFLQRRELAAEPVARRHARAQAVDLVRQPLVLFRGADRLELHALDHADEELHLLLQPIDGFEIHAAGHCLGHGFPVLCLAAIAESRRARARAPPEWSRRSAALRRRSTCDPPGTSAGPTGSRRLAGRPCPDTDRRSSPRRAAPADCRRPPEWCHE